MRCAFSSCSMSLVILLAVGSAAATPLRLTMDEAVARAAASNLEVGSARTAIETARAALAQSRAWLPSNPYVSGGAGVTTQQGVGPNYGFFLSQEFELAGQRGQRIAAATQQLEQTTWDVKNTEQSLAATVKTTFVHALLSSERVTLARQGLETIGRFGQQSHRKRLTDAERLQRNNAQIQQSRARRDVTNAERARRSVHNTLRRLVGLPLAQELELLGTPVHDVRPLPSTERLVQLALERRPDLISQRHSLEYADRQVSLARRAAIPNITVTGNVSRFQGDTITGGDLGFSLPVFQTHSAAITEALADRESTNLDLKNLEEAIREQAIEAADTYHGAATDLQSLKNLIVPKYAENVEIQRRLYKAGNATVADIISAQLELIGARAEYLDAVQAYNDALIDLEQTVGGSFDQ